MLDSLRVQSGVVEVREHGSERSRHRGSKMKANSILPGLRKLVLAGALATGAGSAPAVDLSSFPFTIPLGTPACAPYGDFISCSAQYLNYLVTGSPGGTQTVNYVIDSSQGLLQNALVVFTGGEAAVNNLDVLPGGNVDNAYRGKGQGSVTTYGTMIDAGQLSQGNMIDPTTPVTGENDNGLAVSTNTAWDIGLAQLKSALTINGVRHELLVMFDNNQVGTDPDQNLLIQALACVRQSGGGLPNVCFELVDQNGPGGFPFNVLPTAFTTAKSYGDPLLDSPLGTPSPVLANGTICVDTTTKLPVAFNTNNCPTGSILIDNNLGTNRTEFIVMIPELDAMLETFLGWGYDLLSVQFRATNQNDGFEDIFIVAGAPRVPEPDTIALLGLGLLGILAIGAAARRRKKA